MPSGIVIQRSAPKEDFDTTGYDRIPLEAQKIIPSLGWGSAEKRGFRRGSQAFVFRINDPNGDQLSFRIRLVPESGSAIELERAWQELFFTFDTLLVPDGRYRLEVTATDAPSQPFNAALSSTWRTNPFVVDHTPPTIPELLATMEGENIRVRFIAKDEASTIQDAAISADGENWLFVLPEDAVFDQREESFNVLIPKERVRGSRVMVRVSDACGNEQSATALIGEIRKR
jgi:hypothetical protein